MSAIVGTEFTESVVFQVVSRREEQPGKPVPHFL